MNGKAMRFYLEVPCLVRKVINKREMLVLVVAKDKTEHHGRCLKGTRVKNNVLRNFFVIGGIELVGALS